VRAVRRWLERGRDLFPVTFIGLAALGAAAFVYWKWGKKQSDYILYSAGPVVFGLVALALVFTLLATLRVWLAVRRSPTGIPPGVETTRGTRTSVRFPRLALWPMVQVRLRWREPKGVEISLSADGSALVETVVFAARGFYPRIVRRFTVGDIFGLTSLSFTVTSTQTIRVAPLRAAPTANAFSARSSGDAVSHPAGKQEGDMVEMRRYAYGDPLRNVLWKTYARTRRLLVRMPERAIAPQPTSAAFLVAGAHDDPTASVARMYIEEGLLGTQWVFLADGANGPTARRDEAVDQVIASSAAQAQGGDGLEILIRSVEPSRLGGCLVFAPPVDGPWRERLLAFARRLPSPPTVLVGFDGPLSPPRRRSLVRRLLLDAPALAPRANGLGVLCKTLRQHGIRVGVLHRATGQLLPESALRDM
jgi:hypothetical protein